MGLPPPAQLGLPASRLRRWAGLSAGLATAGPDITPGLNAIVSVVLNHDDSQTKAYLARLTESGTFDGTLGRIGLDPQTHDARSLDMDAAGGILTMEWDGQSVIVARRTGLLDSGAYVTDERDERPQAGPLSCSDVACPRGLEPPTFRSAT